MLRHLPPTAVPLTLTDIKQSWTANRETVTRFSEALRRYLGADTCLLASSGRTALYVLLQQLAQTAAATRQEVILPAYTCPALVKVILDLGLRPLPIDISPHTLAFDREQLEASLSQRTLAVICVHPFGLPQSLSTIQSLARAVEAVVIEDAAQAMGARVAGQPVGTVGDFGLFSLGPGKPLSTGGGGILCTRDEGFGRLLNQAWQSLAAVTAGRSIYTGIRLGLFALAFHPNGWWLAARLGLHRVGRYEASWAYRLDCLTPLQAHIGLSLLPRLGEINRNRCVRAQQIQDAMQDLDFVHFPTPAQPADPIYLRLPIIVDSARRREQLWRRLWSAGIGAGRMYEKSLPRIFPQLASYHCPGADEVASRLLTLPTHHFLTQADIRHIQDTFNGGFD